MTRQTKLLGDYFGANRCFSVTDFEFIYRKAFDDAAKWDHAVSLIGFRGARKGEVTELNVEDAVGAATAPTVPKGVGAKLSTSFVRSPVVIPKDDRHPIGERGNTTGQTQIPIAEITHKQNGIGLKPVQQLFISVAPSAMKISGNRNAQIFQDSCLG